MEIFCYNYVTINFLKGRLMNLIAVIMAGGTGTRFWPVSTEERPKQFLKLFGDRSLLQMSFDRLDGIVPPDRIFIMTNTLFVTEVKNQLPEIPPENIIGEPLKRDTAAAVAIAAFLARKRYGNPVIATFTADQLIGPVDVFQKTVLSAVAMAENTDALYTFGIQPAYPATCYGYLERGPRIATDDGIEHYKLKSFKEKPGLDTAREYVESGRFYWNSGMFVWKTDAIIEQIEIHLQDHARLLAHAVEISDTLQWERSLSEAFEQLPVVSIDFGVMEKAQDIRCVASTFSWRDVGGWLALEEYLPADTSGNRSHGEIIVSDANDNLIFCENKDETVMAIGVNDLVIVRAGTKTLVVHKDQVEHLKKLLNETTQTDK